MSLWIRSGLVVCLFIFSFTPDVSARRIWQENGVPLATESGLIWTECIIDDGTGMGSQGGNLIVIWEDNSSGKRRLYAQLVDTNGNIHWPPEGIPISSRTGDQFHARAVPDLSGGCLVFWMDHQGANIQIYGQHLDSSGNRLWGINGMAVCPFASDQFWHDAVSDGSGGAVVAWVDDRNDIGNLDTDLFAQRVTKQGNRLYAATGSLVYYASTSEGPPSMLSDGSGGAFLCWTNRGSSSVMDNIYAQKLNAQGVIQWGPYGASVCTASGEQDYLVIAHGASGKYWVAWNDWRSGSSEIYMQSLSSAGASEWAADGQLINGSSDHAFMPSMVSDGSGGAFVLYYAERSGSTGLFLRHFRDNSVPVSHDDMPVYEGPGLREITAWPDLRPAPMAPDGRGGCFMVWALDYGVQSSQCYVQHMPSAHRKSFGAAGMPVTTTTIFQNYPVIMQNGVRQSIVAWHDWRRQAPQERDIYAQRFMVQPPLSGVVPLLLE
ncbi:MAG: hypothetical protein D3926_21130 [Desulfobacteraceae bacterium]|nr:MAG: hypothetical protein D3926_21130 [Desulfobacteraceae bacterium]